MQVKFTFTNGSSEIILNPENALEKQLIQLALLSGTQKDITYVGTESNLRFQIKDKESKTIQDDPSPIPSSMEI